MPKNKTAYSQNSSISSIQLNDTVVTLGSTTYRLDGFTTATAPIQWWNKPLTSFANVAKGLTNFTANSLSGTGVTAGSTTVRANSTTVPATGYIAGVPSYDSSRKLTAYVEA